MARDNLTIVKDLYSAFAARDRERLVALLHPDIEWHQNEGFPNGGRHQGAQVVLDEVLARFRNEWTQWRVEIDEWLDAGTHIIALGAYYGTHKHSGRDMRAAFAHVYEVEDGRITRFRQFTDTLMVALASGHALRAD